MQKIVAEQLQRTLDVLSDVEKNAELHALLVNAAREAAKSLQNDHKLMVAGNGGSDADAQNLVAKFVSRLVKNRPALSAVALTTDTSILTPVGNDYGYECTFARQIEALGQPPDVFLAI